MSGQVQEEGTLVPRPGLSVATELVIAALATRHAKDATECAESGRRARSPTRILADLSPSLETEEEQGQEAASTPLRRGETCAV